MSGRPLQAEPVVFVARNGRATAANVRTAAAVGLALLMVGPALAAADAPPDDLDALSMADRAPAARVDATTPWRLFVEGAVGRGDWRDGAAGHHADNTARASLDLRLDTRLAERWRGVLSDRLDVVNGGGAADANTLREAYMSWSRTDHQVIDVGRVNLRHGAAYGYNPTDWFKENALRSVVSPDPAVLRENRLGTVVLQAQQLWTGAALTAAFSPKLGSGEPNAATFSIDAGATNPRNRWLLAGSWKVNDRLNPELLLYGGADTPTQLGLNVSGLVGDAAVAFVELTTGRGRSLTARALGLDEAERTQRRAAVGVTYTTPFNLGVTVEADYNSAAPDRAQWNALPGDGSLAKLAVLGTAAALQDLPVRRSVFVHASWKDVGIRRFDLSAFWRRDHESRSRAQWVEARYRWDRVDLSLQWQLFSGTAGSVYGIVPQRRAVELVLRAYL